MSSYYQTVKAFTKSGESLPQGHGVKNKTDPRPHCLTGAELQRLALSNKDEEKNNRKCQLFTVYRSSEPALRHLSCSCNAFWSTEATAPHSGLKPAHMIIETVQLI